MKFQAPDSKRLPKDEIAVWFSSLGLSLGLVMIIGLLSVILYNGFSVFWPKAVIEIDIDRSASNELGGRQIVAGIVTSKEFVSNDWSLNSKQAPREEWQLFLGNKDVLGVSYKYFDRNEILDIRFPEDLIVLERQEYGNAIVYPVRLTFGEGEQLAATDPFFSKTLNRLIQESDERRRKIRDIEFKKIGAFNDRLETLRLRKIQIERNEPLSESDLLELSSIERETKESEANFRTLATEARFIRDLQNQATLDYKLASGEPGTITIGEIFDYYYPNRLGIFGKIGVFTRHIADFLTTEPREANTEGGVFPAIFGTFIMTLLMTIAVTPFGVLSAIYLREYAKDGLFVRMVRISINNLAGVPSIVFGIFGLGFFVYFVGGTLDQLFFSLRLPTPTFGTGGILLASLTLAIMTVPVVIVATEEALSAVSQGVRESSQACGASKWQTIQRVVLPASAPGILTGMILAMARGAGEVAPLMMLGVVKVAPSLPVDSQFPFIHLERKFMHLGFHIYDLGFQSPDSEAAMPMVFATTLLLIVLVIMLNLTAIIIRNRLKKKYITPTF